MPKVKFKLPTIKREAEILTSFCKPRKTGWDKSMIAAVDYIARVTRGGAHTINTPAQSQRTRRILDAIIKSAETETKINVNEIS